MQAKNTATGIIVFLLLLCGSVNTFSQIRISSPYTRFGIGELRTNSYNTVLMSMGGIRNAANGYNMINIYNPATYISFDSLSFVFEGGIMGSKGTIKTNSISEPTTYASLNHLLFGFQINKWWKSSFGLVPFSDVGYNTVLEQDIDDIGRTLFQYEGSGGISQAYWGHAFKISDSWAAGFNFFYNFGTIDKARTIYFPDSLPYYQNTRLDNKIKVGGISFDFGILNKRKIANDLELSTGLSFSLPQKIRAKREYLANTFQGGLEVQEYFTDTIKYEAEENGYINMPARIGLGVMLEDYDHWKIGIDFNWQNWNSFEAFGYSDSLRNSWDIAIGGEYIPEISSISSYVKKVRYRFGARYSKTPIHIFDKNISEFGISFGLGLPIMRSRSVFNMGFEFGGKGTTANNLVKENYFRFTIGVSIVERWFLRRKYN